MRKYLTKRNIIKMIGIISAVLTIAIQNEIIEGVNAIKYATFTIAFLGYITNDTLDSKTFNKVLGKREE